MNNLLKDIGLLKNKGLIKGYGLLKPEYPLKDLSFLWLGRYDGNDLVNVLGINIPYVSGSGLDAIYDFSVLNDGRFDKGSYVGNSYGLPEYYNYPYVNIYYDATSEATRHHWKLTDFHYANLETQSVNLTNWAFLKAKATTDTSNVIDSVQELLVYSTDYNKTTCYSAGTFYKASTQAYGLVFDGIINKGVDTNLLSVHITSNNNDASGTGGYQFLINSQEGIQINKRNQAILFETVGSYILNNTDYRFLIWRNETENQYVTGGVGTFAVYIQGKNKAITTTRYTVPNTDEMELVDTTGGSGSNPVTDNAYTTSAYIVGDLDSGDNLGNYYIGDNLQDFSEWTEDTGKYAHYNNGEQTGSNLTRLRNYSNLYNYLGTWTYKS